MTKLSGPMAVFTLEARQVFDSYLLGFGFAYQKSRTEEYLSEVEYRKNEQYILLSANIHPRDYPPSFNIILGEGSTNWPESDWNSTALWRIKQRYFPNRRANEYSIKDLETFLKPLAASKSDLQKYADDFIRGDLTVFKETRSDQNKRREPYKIYTPDSNGGYSMCFDEEAKSLKERFS